MKKRKIRIRLRHCPSAEIDHKVYLRQYLHVGHKEGDVVCYAREFFDLPYTHFMALIAHEVGHLLGGMSEKEANKLAENYFGIKIYYQDTIFWGKNLEWISLEDVEKVSTKVDLVYENDEK